MANALYTGLIDPPANASSSIPFQCSTGNCTFPEDRGATHMSLAMCGSCTDISDTIQRNTTEKSWGGWVPYSYYLPSNPPDAIGNLSIGGSGDFRWLSKRAYGPSLASEYISAFDTLMYRAHSCTNTSVESCMYEPLPANCAIYPCMKTCWANVTNFVLDEKQLSTT